MCNINMTFFVSYISNPRYIMVRTCALLNNMCSSFNVFIHNRGTYITMFVLLFFNIQFSGNKDSFVTFYCLVNAS